MSLNKRRKRLIKKLYKKRRLRLRNDFKKIAEAFAKAFEVVKLKAKMLGF